MDKNFYQILGVSENATDAEIKSAYRALSLQYHPDKQGIDSTEQFQKIGEAYDTLKDSERRQMYDMQRNPNIPEWDPSHIFEAFFNGNMGMPGNIPHGFRVYHTQSRMQKAPPIQKTIPISLEQAYQGFTLSLDVDKESIVIPIPKGIDDKEVVVLTGKGHRGHDRANDGDLHLIIEIQPHPSFKRNQSDLYCKKTIPLKEALCGFVVEITHLNGKILRLSNHANLSVVKPGFKKEIAGYGMSRGDDTGKLVVEFEVLFPDNLTPQQIEVISAIL